MTLSEGMLELSRRLRDGYDERQIEQQLQP